MDDGEADLASTKVIRTYELVEKILSHLCFKDLINAQHVCHKWRELTSRSKILRSNLMLEDERSANNEDPSWSELLIDRLVPIVRQEQQYQYLTIRPNPLLKRGFIWSYTGAPWYYRLYNEDIRRMLSWDKGFWEDTLISQPAPFKVKIYLKGRPYPEGKASVLIEDPNGVRLGNLVTAIFGSLKHRNVVGFREDLVGSEGALPPLCVEIINIYEKKHA